jgi:hypothetical protein
MKKILKREVLLSDVVDKLAESFSKVFGTENTWIDKHELDNIILRNE